MTDNESKQTGGPQVMLRGLLAVVAIAVVAIVGLLLWPKINHNASDGPQQVGMLDSDAIYALPEFTKAKKELEDFSKSLEEKLLKSIKEKKLSPAEAESLRVQMRQQLEQEQAKKLKPLNDRVTASIASLANERKYRVVLDKRIVVTGVTDITEDVKKRFAETKTADLPKESPESQSHVGYVNEEAVASLRIYTEANEKLAADYETMAKDFAAKAGKMSQIDKDKVRNDLTRQFQEREAEVLKPVNEKVNQAITDVARDKGLSLVLNSHHIMWGGRNLTDDVIKKLVNTQAKG